MLKRHSLLSPYLSLINKASFNMQGMQTCQNLIVLKTAYSAFLCCTADLLEQLGYSPESRSFRLALLCDTLCSSDPIELLIASKNGYDRLIEHLSGKTRYSYDDFKGHLSNNALLGGALVAPLNKTLSVLFCTEASKSNDIWTYGPKREAKACCQYFGFLSKLELDNPTLVQEALEAYKVAEGTYPNQCSNQALVARLRSIIASHLRDFDYDGMLAKHGNGSVADKIEPCLCNKYAKMEVDSLLSYAYKHNRWLDYSSPFDQALLSPLPISSTLSRTSRLAFVPKNVAKVRSISMEPVMLQYAQQGVMKALYEYFKTNKFYSKHVRLEDQSLNQTLAYCGSTSDFYSTLDLSAASDSVGIDLVKSLFRDTPKLYKWLMATRSTATELPDGQTINLKKFAPMGSACCFPVETIVFAACAELAIELAGNRPDFSVPKTPNLRHFCVYGDDIIVPYYAYDSCIDVLAQLGFKVNQDKSFHRSPFKESCGVNYLAGFDLTPFRWKGQIFSKGGYLTPEGFETLCSYANNAYERGLKHVRCLVLDLMRKYNCIPFFSLSLGELPRVFSPTPTNFHCKKVRSGQGFEQVPPSTTFALLNMRGASRGIRYKAGRPHYERCASFNGILLRPNYHGVYAVVTGVTNKVTEESTDIDEKVRLYETLRSMSTRSVSLCEYNLNAKLKTQKTLLFGEAVSSYKSLVFDVESPLSVSAIKSTTRRFSTRLQPLWA